jgi:hypothetical protein
VRAWGRRGLVALVVAALVVPAAVNAAAAQTGGQGSGFTAEGVQPTSSITGAKSTSGKLARTDPSLRGRTDATSVPIVVKLDFDPAATYTGDVDGLAATSPKVTGRVLTGDSPAEQAYESYTDGVESSFVGALHQAVPSAAAGVRLLEVYGGVAVQVPANAIDKVLAIPGVAAVQADSVQHPLTDASPTFIGAPTLWGLEGGQAGAGKGVIFGSLDTGAWPEHPSFIDDGTLGAPPAKADGTPRACVFGDNPLTTETDPFVCNNKLIGGQPFLDSYNRVVGGELYPDSARDSDGHGPRHAWYLHRAHGHRGHVTEADVHRLDPWVKIEPWT